MKTEIVIIKAMSVVMIIKKILLLWGDKMAKVMALCCLLFSFAAPSPLLAADDVLDIKKIDWSFSGPFGTFDRGALQRGYKVYKNVCASCHSMSLLSFRNLSQPGGPSFSEAQVKALAAEYMVSGEPDADGEISERPGEPRDKFPSPYANENVAKASNNGAMPPDLSVIVKARKYGADYIYSLLTGYADAPQGIEIAEGQYYNKAYSDNNADYPGGALAMAPPLSDDIVEYTDGTAQTVQQYSKDVTYFLTWAAEPTMEARKRIGFQVMVFLLFLVGLLLFATRKIWREVKK